MPLSIVRNDITKMNVDAVVNAANSALQAGGGVCGAIFDAADAKLLQAECDIIGKCDVGQAVITKGYNLPSKHIIHTVGPIWQGGGNNESEQLANCYKNSLLLAQKNNCKSIAFPLVSSGIYGYPKDETLRIAISSIGGFLLKNDMLVYLVVYDKNSFVLSEKLFSSIERYIDDNYVDERNYTQHRRRLESNEFNSLNEYKISDLCQSAPEPLVKAKRNLDDVVAQLDEPFSRMLLRLIDEKGMTDVETYKKANIDRKLFSKIRSDINYRPSKLTAIAFAIALELSLDETKDLLCKAGFALTHSSKFDVIIEFFIDSGNYDIFEINKALFAFEQDLLGV